MEFSDTTAQSMQNKLQINDGDQLMTTTIMIMIFLMKLTKHKNSKVQNPSCMQM